MGGSRLSIYIYIMYTPNLGLRIAVFDREREQGGAPREHYGAVLGRCRWGLEMTPSVSLEKFPGISCLATVLGERLGPVGCYIQQDDAPFYLLIAKLGFEVMRSY